MAPLPRPTTDQNLLSGVGLLADALDQRENQRGLSLRPVNQTKQWGVSFDTGTLTWPGGSAFSNALVVNHLLAITPSSVVTTPRTSTGLNFAPVLAITAQSATTFTVVAATVDAQNPLNTATTPFYWVAIG